MDFLIKLIGVFIFLVGIANFVSTLFIISVLSEHGEKASFMTPISNMRKLKKLIETKEEHQGLYYLSKFILYSVLVIIMLLALLIILNAY